MVKPFFKVVILWLTKYETTAYRKYKFHTIFAFNSISAYLIAIVQTALSWLFFKLKKPTKCYLMRPIPITEVYLNK
ncbi:hypothetical protein SMBr_11150 [Shewanella sp. M-Br]|nr:hypothetical protein SMBr_11150 [Shewanella sp. M-Br]